MLPSTPSETAAVVIASRETAHTLLATLDALQRAIQAPTLIDVVVNGNPALASQLLTLLRSRQLLQRSTSSALRLWTLALGDKAHSMNEYLHPKLKAAPHLARPRAGLFRRRLRARAR